MNYKGYELTVDLSKRYYATLAENPYESDKLIYSEVLGIDLSTEYWDAVDYSLKREIEHELCRLWNPIDDTEVGDGLTILRWSDRHAGTVIKRTAKSITIRRDKATRLTKPEMIPGGFSAVCLNNNEIEYEYESDENGSVEVIRRNKKGHWKLKGSSRRNGHDVIRGRHEFYDYNF